MLKDTASVVLALLEKAMSKGGLDLLSQSESFTAKETFVMVAQGNLDQAEGVAVDGDLAISASFQVVVLVFDSLFER